MIDNSVFEGVDSQTLYRRGIRYLQSLDDLPQQIKNFIREFPFSSAMAFVIGSKAVTWFCSDMYQRLMGEAIDGWYEQPLFPLHEFYCHGGFQAEFDVIAYIGYIYEIDYLRKSGYDMSSYSPRSMKEYVNYYLQGNLKNIEFSVSEEDGDVILQKYEAHNSVMTMLKEGKQPVPRMLEESRSILRLLLE